MSSINMILSEENFVAEVKGQIFYQQNFSLGNIYTLYNLKNDI